MNNRAEVHPLIFLLILSYLFNSHTLFVHLLFLFFFFNDPPPPDISPLPLHPPLPIPPPIPPVKAPSSLAPRSLSPFLSAVSGNRTQPQFSWISPRIALTRLPSYC